MRYLLEFGKDRLPMVLIGQAKDNHIQRIIRAANINEAKNKAKQILELELGTANAEYSLTLMRTILTNTEMQRIERLKHSQHANALRFEADIWVI